MTSEQVPQQPKTRLPRFLLASIGLLVAVTIGAIAMIFVGDLEGKGLRIAWTFVIFGVFVTYTAFDGSRDYRNDWYGPAALIANVYFLGVSLTVIWVTRYMPFGLGWTIFWKVLGVGIVMRLLLLACQWLLGGELRRPQLVTAAAGATAVLMILTGALFTVPAAVSAFEIVIPELYWKIAVSVLILSALGLSIFVLLRWHFRKEIREMNPGYFLGKARRLMKRNSAPAVVHAPRPEPEKELLPWPRFEDGTPLPALPNGQPDFSVPGAPYPPHLLRENQRGDGTGAPDATAHSGH